MASQTDYYEILQVHPAAHQDVIQAAYRRLTLRYHPDRNAAADATATMARLNEAYAVLSDPEKRAAYDRSRGEQTQTGHDIRTWSGSGSGDGYSYRWTWTERTGSGGSKAEYFTIGSNKDEVRQVQGQPSRTDINHRRNKETWHYGDSTHRSSVEFDLSTGLVRKWTDSLELLKVRIIPGPNVTNAQFCSLGSHKDDVLRLVGTPGKFSTNKAQAKETWYYGYGYSKIEFQLHTGRIQGWENTADDLKQVRIVQGHNTTNSDFISPGSHKDDVIRLIGQPYFVSAARSPEQWRYSGAVFGTVEFVNDRAVSVSLRRKNSRETGKRESSRGTGPTQGTRPTLGTRQTYGRSTTTQAGSPTPEPPPSQRPTETATQPEQPTPEPPPSQRPTETATQPEQPTPRPQSEPANEQHEHPASSNAATVPAAIEVGHLKSEVYGLLGAPTKIEQTNKAEVWYYGENWFAFSLDAQAVIDHGDASSPPLAEEPKTAPSPWEWLTGDNPPIEKPEPAQNDDPPLSETLTGEEQSQSEFTEPSEPAQEVQAPSEETSQINGYSKWRAPESPAKLGKTAAMGEGKGCLLPVSLISAAVVAAPIIWFLI